jgi:hypothetical protein
MPESLSTNEHAMLRTAEPASARRVLVVASQTVTSPSLIAEMRDRATRGPVDFHLIVPALNSHLRHWLSDTDDAVLEAHHRGHDALKLLKSHGLRISVHIGDSVPLLAIGDALSEFEADEILISTLPPGRSHWLERNLVELARRKFDVPVRQVVAREELALAA